MFEEGIDKMGIGNIYFFNTFRSFFKFLFISVSLMLIIQYKHFSVYLFLKISIISRGR